MKLHDEHLWITHLAFKDSTNWALVTSQIYIGHMAIIQFVKSLGYTTGNHTLVSASALGETLAIFLSYEK